jgi:hypothetical protein
VGLTEGPTSSSVFGIFSRPTATPESAAHQQAFDADTPAGS